MVTKLKVACVCLGLFTFVGCGGGGGTDSADNACSALKVSNGDNCDYSTSSVVAILAHTTQGAIICTGTVIADKVVLTAAHCVNDVSSLMLGTPAGVLSSDQGFISQVIYDRRYDPSGGVAVPFDLGVIRLNVSTGARPVPILGSDSVGLGETVSVFGYGQDETSQTFLDRLQVGEYEKVLKAGQMLIGLVSVDRRNLFATFDSTGQSACPGDSGGPAIVRIGGESVIAGVVSYGSRNNCLSGSYVSFGNLGNSEVRDFIRRAAPEARVEG